VIGAVVSETGEQIILMLCDDVAWPALALAPPPIACSCPLMAAA
jgi:hypothetical protein